MFTTVFIFNPLAKGALSILHLLTGRSHRITTIRKIGESIMRFESEDDDSEYEDPSPEELLKWIYADDDDRIPEEDQYGE